MRFIYDLGIQLFFFGIKLTSIWNVKAQKWVNGRRNNLEELRKENIKGCIWIHCASLGEFEQITPLIEAIKENSSSKKILISFFSPSGYEIRKNYKLVDHVTYLPLDTSKNAKTFISLVKPEIAIFVRYEFWYHHLYELHQKKIKTYFICSLFRDNQIYFRWYGSWFRQMLSFPTYYFTLNKDSKNILEKINLKNAMIAGDTRYDKVNNTALVALENSIVRDFKQSNTLLVFGSSWAEEENIAIDYINNNQLDGLKIILAPHEINSTKINALIEKINVSCFKYSEVNTLEYLASKILIIDNIGLLAGIYKYADIAFVGGGFSGKLHNVLEPATFGVPVLFGPKISSFPEAMGLVNAGGGFPIKNKRDFEITLKKLTNSVEREKVSDKSKQFIQNNTGATKLIYDKIFPA